MATHAVAHGGSAVASELPGGLARKAEREPGEEWSTEGPQPGCAKPDREPHRIGRGREANPVGLVIPHVREREEACNGEAESVGDLVLDPEVGHIEVKIGTVPHERANGALA